ncbi:hypothetical protein HAX54_049928, partial [Datura stramonium]|nr:hypothetical protein [Datura stramonium]
MDWGNCVHPVPHRHFAGLDPWSAGEMRVAGSGLKPFILTYASLDCSPVNIVHGKVDVNTGVNGGGLEGFVKWRDFGEGGKAIKKINSLTSTAAKLATFGGYWHFASSTDEDLSMCPVHWFRLHSAGISTFISP